MNNTFTGAWSDVVDQSPEGIVVCDATAKDHPVVYANEAFARLCGHPAAGLIGRNLRMLQGSDTDQEGRQRLREALMRGEPCRVLLRNYRPDGAQFWNEIVLQPVRDAAGTLVQWVSWHREMRDRVNGSSQFSLQGLPAWMREDRLTGLQSRGYVEELLARDWSMAQRDGGEIGMAFFDIDDLGAYNSIFDRTAGDACIRRVARVIGGSYRRSGDLVGRWDGGTFVVLTHQVENALKAHEYAKSVLDRVRNLMVHHPRASFSGRYLTLSAGACTLSPPRDMELAECVAACTRAMQRAKGRGKNTVCTPDSADFGVAAGRSTGT